MDDRPRAHVPTRSLGRVAVRVVRLIAGMTLMAIGVAGLVLPALPGTPFLLVGLGVLGSESERAHRASLWLRGLVHRGRPAGEGAGLDAP